MSNSNSDTVFEKILGPVFPLLKEEADKLEKDAITYKLSFYFFSLNILYAIIKKIRSIGLLVTDIKTSSDAKTLGLVQASRSMYSEAFIRYHPSIFRRVFYRLLEQLNFLEVPEIKAFGKLLCIDGSVFPAFQTMEWAHYKKTANAVKMHLALELNRMLPVQFISTDANSSEKKALLAMLEAGVTYIADRGYLGFSLFYQIAKKEAYFIIRIKTNLKYTSQEILNTCIPPQWQAYVSKVNDYKITFTNDKKQSIYRLVIFVAMGETYFIATNRFDLKTYEVIMLYAYRWQVELFFRCIKRTFNALHLWSHDPKGIEIHFHVYLITYVLLLYFKQDCERQDSISFQGGLPDERGSESESLPETTCGYLPESRVPPACGVVSLLGGRLRKYWKIGIHWLTTGKNRLFQPFTQAVARVINSS
ncbi:MAG: IS4 family transposase [Deltaproteobacteria bacterium]|nr:IS4 family transposase [Deltaproteobacteria bacterium]